MVDTPDPAAPAASGETATPQAPSNDVTPPAAAPAANVVDQAEVERLRKEAEQAKMRAQQLENEKAAREKADKEREAKELEENQQFKTLAEQEKARADAAEAKLEEDKKAAELKSEAEKVFADYSPEVRKLAETTGLTLTDTDEDAVKAFKAKLDEVKGMVGGGRVSPNNPSTPTPSGPTITDEDGMIKTPLENDPGKLDNIFKSMPGIASMMGPNSDQES